MFQERSPSPFNRPTSPGPDPSAQQRGRQRAVAHIRPISIPDIVRDVSGTDPMRTVRDLDRAYMPEGQLCVNSAVSTTVEARRSKLKRRAEKISRSYSEIYAMLTSGNSSHAEAARLLKTITNVAVVAVAFLALRVFDKMSVFLS